MYRVAKSAISYQGDIKLQAQPSQIFQIRVIINYRVAKSDISYQGDILNYRVAKSVISNQGDMYMVAESVIISDQGDNKNKGQLGQLFQITVIFKCIWQPRLLFQIRVIIKENHITYGSWLEGDTIQITYDCYQPTMMCDKMCTISDQTWIAAYAQSFHYTPYQQQQLWSHGNYICIMMSQLSS